LRRGRSGYLPQRCHVRRRAYLDRRVNEGLAKKEIIRRLKRYVAREVYHHLCTG